ncbi:MAG: SIS domain-containing protein [bacterium]
MNFNNINRFNPLPYNTNILLCAAGAGCQKLSPYNNGENMNTIEAMYRESNSIEEFAPLYFQYLSTLLNKIDTKAIAAFVDELERAWRNQNTIFVIGNGGSAATASHMANDIGVDVLKKSGTQQAFRVMALTDNVSVMTAIANDTGYENLFITQLKIHYRPGDTLIAISASGNSPNVVAAAEWVKSRDGKVIGITGFDGGKLKDISDIVIWIETQKGEFGPVEDIHLILDHLVASWLQYKCVPTNK